MVCNTIYHKTSGVNSYTGSYNYKKYSNYGKYNKRDEVVEKREAEPEPEPASYSGYGG